MIRHYDFLVEEPSTLPADSKIIVLVDRDDEDCLNLKQRIEEMARSSGLVTRSKSTVNDWQVAVRIAIEELEAWYFKSGLRKNEVARELGSRLSFERSQSNSFRVFRDLVTEVG
jgi:hypothetical protein